MGAGVVSCAPPNPLPGRRAGPRHRSARRRPLGRGGGSCPTAAGWRTRVSCSPRFLCSARAASAAAAAGTARESPSGPDHFDEWGAEEVEAWREGYASRGFLVVRGLLSADEVASLQSATDALERGAADMRQSTIVKRVYFEVQSATGRKGDVAVSPGLLRKITFPSKTSAAFARLKCHPRVTQVASEICGVLGDVECVVDQVNLKPPRVGTGFPWHQDVSFLKPKAREQWEAFGGCNAVVALDRSDASNGGFTVLSGTHLAGERWAQLRDAYDGSPASDALDLFDTRLAVCEALDPGDALFFHPVLAHGSRENVSDARRRIATLWLVGSRPNAENEDDDGGGKER